MLMSLAIRFRVGFLASGACHRAYESQGQRRVDGGSVPRRSFAWLISARSPTVVRVEVPDEALAHVMRQVGGCAALLQEFGDGRGGLVGLVAQVAGRPRLLGVLLEADEGFDPYGLSYAETLAGEPLRLSARRFGNAARFVNHASVKPNAEIVRVVHRGLLRVVIVAREAIAPGGQVLVDYGDAYWRASGVAPRPLPRILADVGTDRYRF